ncbi:MAG: metallopeptidase family protein [Minisyncoccia bacterium]
MNRSEFEQLIAEEFPHAVPEKFRTMVKNVAFLVEDEPSREVRAEEGLARNETLLGLYRGVPRAVRGDYYGVGPTVPDVIVLYRLPIHDEANEIAVHDRISADEALRRVVNETIWHEVAHYLGLGEEAVRAREEERRAEEHVEPAKEERDVAREFRPRTDDTPPNLPTLE